MVFFEDAEVHYDEDAGLTGEFCGLLVNDTFLQCFDCQLFVGKIISQNNPQLLAAQGWDVLGTAPADFAVVLKSELDKWSKVVKGAKIKEN